MNNYEVLPTPVELIKRFKDFFYQAECVWERKREDRLVIEEGYENYSGKLDGIELHIPFTKYDYAFKMMADTEKYQGNKGLICAGDNVNLDMFSYFYKTSKDLSRPFVEMNNFIRFLKVAEKVYDFIIVMTTNHDHRIEKIINKIAISRISLENREYLLLSLSSISRNSVCFCVLDIISLISCIILICF